MGGQQEDVDLGGAASADANATSVFKVRALDVDGGYADLNVSLSLSDNLNAETLSDSFPAFSNSLADRQAWLKLRNKLKQFDIN